MLSTLLQLLQQGNVSGKIWTANKVRSTKVKARFVLGELCGPWRLGGLLSNEK